MFKQVFFMADPTVKVNMSLKTSLTDHLSFETNYYTGKSGHYKQVVQRDHDLDSMKDESST